MCSPNRSVKAGEGLLSRTCQNSADIYNLFFLEISEHRDTNVVLPSCYALMCRVLHNLHYHYSLPRGKECHLGPEHIQHWDNTVACGWTVTTNILTCKQKQRAMKCKCWRKGLACSLEPTNWQSAGPAEASEDFSKKVSMWSVLKQPKWDRAKAFGVTAWYEIPKNWQCCQTNLS